MRSLTHEYIFPSPMRSSPCMHYSLILFNHIHQPSSHLYIYMPTFLLINPCIGINLAYSCTKMRCVHVQLCGPTHSCTHILMPFYSSCHPPMSHYHYLICAFLLRVLLFEDDLLGSVNVLRGRRGTVDDRRRRFSAFYMLSEGDGVVYE